MPEKNLHDETSIFLIDRNYHVEMEMIMSSISLHVSCNYSSTFDIHAIHIFNVIPDGWMEKYVDCNSNSNSR